MIPHNGKKQFLPPPDELSNLPERVIDEILMRLPLRDTVRTSILSKKWRYDWRRLSQLKLDQTLWKTTEDLISPTIGFTNILCHLFVFLTGSITKFTLDIPDLETCPNIDHLIYFLYRKNIQHLVLKLPFHNIYEMPSSFFISSGLRHLSLKRCLVCPPPIFKGFDMLISLELKYVTISSESLRSLISHCRLLENLVLKGLFNPKTIEISAPKLRSFVFSGNIHLIHLENVPLLSYLSYKPTIFYVEAVNDFANIFESIPTIENLCWNHFHVQGMNERLAEVIPTRLSSALNCLRRLCISSIALGEFFELSLALCLIRSSPYLEEIKIMVYVDPDNEYYDPVPRNAMDEIPTSFSDMIFNHLRTIKIQGVTGAAAEMQLIKVLLVKSPAMVRMVIEPYKMMNIKRSFKVLAEITKFQRASSKAEVVYNVD